MLRLARIVWTSAVALLALASPAAAQDLGSDCQSSRQWTIDRLGTDHVKLIGQVEIECGEQSFAAGEVELFTDTHRLIATGDVVFTSGKNRIAADRLEYNTQTRTGVFHNATGTAILKEKTGGPQERDMFGTSEPDIYFYGKTLEKVGREKYKITDGGFTTCVQPTPRWQLTSGTVLLNLDHYALMTNSLFKVKGVPVLYLPVFYYPINDEDRSTGLLIPTYGTSTVRGQTISNAFFWAISRSQDATLLHDWYSRTGQGLGAEYRYVTAPGSEGQIRFYNLREHEAQYTSETGSVVSTPERRSYEVRGTLSQRLGRRFRARGRADYFSDITVQQTYNQNIYDSSRRTRLYSGSVTGTLGGWNLTGAFDRSEFFYGTTQSTVRGGTPKISAQRSEKPLFGSPVYFSVSTEGANFTAQRKVATAVVDNGVARFDIFPRVRVPFTKWQWLTVSTSAAFRYTYWTESLDDRRRNVEDPISRNYYELSAQVAGPTFNRIWNRPGSGYAEKIKHSIEPYFNVQRVSPIEEFDRYVQIDGVDTVVGQVTRISYGVNNRFFRKPGGGGRSSEMVTVALGQSYYTDARAAQYDKYYQTANGSAPSRFSPLSLQVRAWPATGVNAQFRAEYDTTFHAFRTMSADSTVAIREDLHSTFGWSQRRFVEGLPGFDDPDRLDHYLNSSTSWRALRNRIGGSYSFNYDIKTGRYLQQRLLTYYNVQCCGFAVEYQQFDLSGFGTSLPVQKDQRFNFSITLAGIGSFSNFFGAFGGGGSGAQRY